jgi:hypothetical protein
MGRFANRFKRRIIDFASVIKRLRHSEKWTLPRRIGSGVALRSLLCRATPEPIRRGTFVNTATS